MTHLYGSKAVPKKSFGEGTPELKAFYQAVEEMLPGADQLNRDLLRLWNPKALAHSWTLPDGFEVVIKSIVNQEQEVTFLGRSYMVTRKVNAPQEHSLSMGANIIHSIDGMIIREMGRRCNYDADLINGFQEMYYVTRPGGTSGTRKKDIALLRLISLYEITDFVSAVFFEHIDENNFGLLSDQLKERLIQLVDDLPQISFPLICIHDCFKFHPSYGNDVRRQYKHILAELAASHVLGSIASEIRGEPVKVIRGSGSLPGQILSSEYAIC